MLVGPTLCGKSQIMSILTDALSMNGKQHRVVIMNPKAITAQQMYGVLDPLSDEWTPGVFASIWEKSNNRNNKYYTWIVCDGPVDAIWIENLNTVLDDNKILTLANNDRIPMTDNCRLVFEVENLNNASPATVSRAGIIYVSQEDLGWVPLITSWIDSRKYTKDDLNKEWRCEEAEILKILFDEYVINSNLFDFLARNTKTVMPVTPSIMITQTLTLMNGLLSTYVENNETPPKETYKKLLTYALIWGCGGLLENEDRFKFSNFLQNTVNVPYPNITDNSLTLYEFRVNKTEWEQWKPQEWDPPKKLEFSSILIPTLDSVRAEALMDTILNLPIQKKPSEGIPWNFRAFLLVGGSGTAKTSTALMFLNKYDLTKSLSKQVNFSSATSPGMLQKSVESEVERKTGKTFCPPFSKWQTMFLDDMSMPIVNAWGDQITLELGRQLIEQGGCYFLDKDKRGDFKTIENFKYIGAMNHPGGGRNDIPNRLKSKYFSINMVPPSMLSIDNIYGAMVRARFTTKNGVNQELIDISKKLTKATINLWESAKKDLLPTPARFHYVFTMRELSRAFQGILSAPIDVLKNQSILISLWKHECLRVFSDKLSRNIDKEYIDNTINNVCIDIFGEKFLNKNIPLWADFLQDDQTDDDGEIINNRIYEPCENITILRNKSREYLSKYNDQFQSKCMHLVLFDDALLHLLRISRIIQSPRGSAMLVGVGGSGKQSLTRLAAFIGNQSFFQISITKQYGDAALFDDLRALSVDTGQLAKPTTFLMTDGEVKQESFLEYINSVLSTGEIAGLFQKEERDVMCSEIRSSFIKERPGIDDDPVNLYRYFIDRLRDNLHIVLCFSPVGQKFATRAQKFPGLFANVTINWFLPWPEAALTEVSKFFIEKHENDSIGYDRPFKIITEAENKDRLFMLMGKLHSCVNEVCTLYFTRMRRHVYITPKTFLAFVDFYKIVYEEKLFNVQQLEENVNKGLLKLDQAEKDIADLQTNLEKDKKELKIMEGEISLKMTEVQAKTAKAEKKKIEVAAEKADCLKNKEEIENDKEIANKDLEAALPFLREAEEAANSISQKDVTELKSMKSPSEIIKLVFDGVLILQMKSVVAIKSEKKTINKQEVDFVHDSFDEYAKPMLCDARFMTSLFEFSSNEKDNINDETCELLEPYLALENFNAAVAKKASNAAEGLCKWVRAMVMYHSAAKIVKPKMDFLKIQESKLCAAMTILAEKEAEMNEAQAEVDGLNAAYEEAMSKKNAAQQQKESNESKMTQASKLLNGLAGEKARWTEDSRSFADERKRLVGDTCIAAAFVTYCGPFNTQFRKEMVDVHFLKSCHELKVPGSESVNMIDFLVDGATIAKWGVQGLPADELSVQNGIMVSRSKRYPLMIDPQGQANMWLKKKYENDITGLETKCISTAKNKYLKDNMVFCIENGLPMVVEDVEEEIDPLLDPVLERQFIKKGNKLFVNIADQNVEFDLKGNFTMAMTSRLANPHFSPELAAKCMVIDFTVTIQGLEQQLLGRVLSMEQKVLEESLKQLMEDVASCQEQLQDLDNQLLEKLSSSEGNLLEDEELVLVLNNTKEAKKSADQKLKDAEEKKIEINEKREQYRPVATRGSIMYFCMVSMSLVSWMYNSSLDQFLDQFDKSVRSAEKASPTQKRVEKIVEYLTYQAYRYVNRGLFERHKRTFVLLFTLKKLEIANKITQTDTAMLLKAGSSLSMADVKIAPPVWLKDKMTVWLNVLQLSTHPFGVSQIKFFKDLPEQILTNPSWKIWFDENDPESVPIPEFEERIVGERDLGSFMKFCLVRCMREDRSVVSSGQFVDSEMGKIYTDPVTDRIEDIWAESTGRTPILFLLSPGADPTGSIDDLAKKKKKIPNR
eukprot:GHVL01016321.1.p1 GENE.GHVL01016321.1~~GHVL01016321.1.p1  ORF type:complete len:1870 (+),score=456.95 GHVL01016321.1:3343-8952(+)